MVILDITAVNIALPSLAARSRAERLDGRLDDHELLADLRQPAPLRRPRGRPRRPQAAVHDRPRRLHRVVARLRDGRHRGSALRGARRPGPRRGDALPGGALDHHDGLPGQSAREGARGVGRGRRRRRRDRRPRRRRPHRGCRLAADLLRQPPRRDRARRDRAEGRSRATSRSPAGAAWTCPARCSPPASLGALVFAITQAAAPAGRRRRRSGSPRSALVGPRRLRGLASAGRRTRSCVSSGWPIAPSAAGSS